MKKVNWGMVDCPFYDFFFFFERWLRQEVTVLNWTEKKKPSYGVEMEIS